MREWQWVSDSQPRSTLLAQNTSNSMSLCSFGIKIPLGSYDFLILHREEQYLLKNKKDFLDHLRLKSLNKA